MELRTVLETERLRLTNWLPEHADDLFALHGDPEVARYLSLEGSPWTHQQVVDRIALWEDDFAQYSMGKLRLIRKSDDVLVGRAGFGIHPPTGEPEIGYALFREHWGSGYAFEAAAGLRDWIFRETDRDHFIGFADIRNTASIRILQGIGMEPTKIEREPGGLMCQFHIYTRENWGG